MTAPPQLVPAQLVPAQLVPPRLVPPQLVPAPPPRLFATAAPGLGARYPMAAAKMCIAVSPDATPWLTSGSVTYRTVLPAWSGTAA